MGKVSSNLEHEHEEYVTKIRGLLSKRRETRKEEHMRLIRNKELIGRLFLGEILL